MPNIGGQVPIMGGSGAHFRGVSDTIGVLDRKLGTGTEAPSVSQQAR